MFNVAGGFNTTQSLVDTIPPVITINPPQTVYNLFEGGSFNIPIGTSTDDVDGVKTITPAGSVNTNVAGTYTLVYSDSDLAGNIAIPVIVTVNIIADITAPVITINPAQTTYTVEAGSSFTPPIGTSTDNVDGIQSVTPTGTVNVNEVGQYVLVYSAVDSSGNVATPITVTVNVVDTTAPVITINPTQTVYAVELGSSFTPPTGVSTDFVDGTKTIIPTGAVNTNVEGVYTLTYSSTDSSGNSAEPVIVTVTVADTIAPVITVSGDPITIIELGQHAPSFIAITDDGSPVVVGGDAVDNMNLGTYRITFDSVDQAGNEAIQVVRDVEVIVGTVASDYYNTVGTLDKADELWQHSDNYWFVPVTNPETFIEAEYLISDTSGKILLDANLTTNVAVIEGGFLIKVSNFLITFSGICNHQFVLTDSLGNKRPPVFFRKAFVNSIALKH